MKNAEKIFFNKIFWKESLNNRERLRTEQELKIGQVKKGDSVLDLRCGPGFKSKIVRDKIGAEGNLICVDNNDYFIKKAKNLYNYENVKFIKGDNLNVFDLLNKKSNICNDFDYVILSWIYSPLEEISKIIKNIKKLLKKEGGLIVSRGGDNFKDNYTKVFNESINNNIFKIIEKEYPKKVFSLENLEQNLKRGRVDIKKSFKDVLKIIKDNGFVIKKRKNVVYNINVEERLELYKNPLRTKYIGSLLYKKRFEIIKEAIDLTIKEIGKKDLAAFREYVYFEKIILK